MALRVLLTVLLVPSLNFVAANEPPPVLVSTCVDLALARGDSPEGWTAVKDKFCEQNINRLICMTGVNYFNILNNGDNDCCDAPKQVTWQNEHARSGWCCNSGERWVGDKEGNGGRCCPGDTKLVDGICERPVTPVETGRVYASQCPRANDYACADDNNLGITYGSCYIITFPDGKQLGRNCDDDYYVKDGCLQDIPFKVCRQAKHCTGIGSVGHGGSFTLKDQVGRVRDETEVKGWITDGMLRLTLNPHAAVSFRGSATLTRGACAVRLTSATSRGGLGFTHSMLGFSLYPNKRAGLSLHFTEVDCDGGVPVQLPLSEDGIC